MRVRERVFRYLINYTDVKNESETPIWYKIPMTASCPLRLW